MNMTNDARSMTRLATRVRWHLVGLSVSLTGYAILLLLPVFFGQSLETAGPVPPYVYWRTLAYLGLPPLLLVATLYTPASWFRYAAFVASGALAVNFAWRIWEIVLDTMHVTAKMLWMVIVGIAVSLTWSCWRWARNNEARSAKP